MKADDPRTWPEKAGKSLLIKHLDGKRLTPTQAIKAMHYSCTGAFDAGQDCKCPDCPLYQFQPYGTWGLRPKRKMSPETRARLASFGVQHRRKHVPEI